MIKIPIFAILQVSLLAGSMFIFGSAWTKEAPNAINQQAPLSNLDRMLSQANGFKVDAIVDNKLAANVTNALNDMAQSLRKMFVENRRLNIQVQDLIGRVQNATGINANNTLGNIQQQAMNMTNLTGLYGQNGQMNLSSLMQRFGQ